MIEHHIPRRALAGALTIALGFLGLATEAQALSAFGASADIVGIQTQLHEGGPGAFSASKTFSVYNGSGNGINGYAAADLAGAKLHASSLAVRPSCNQVGGENCNYGNGIATQAAMWDTLTFVQKDGGPIENISLLPTYLEIDGHLSGEWARAKYRYYMGSSSDFDLSGLAWEELGDGTRENLDIMVVPLSTTPVFVYFELWTSAFTDGVFDSMSVADFGNTMSFNLVLPDDMAVQSASGVFLTNGASAVPEPATWAMMILGFGLVGVAVRRRPSPLSV